MRTICLVTSLYALENFLIEQILELKKIYKVYIILNANQGDITPLVGQDVCFIKVSIFREISLISDLKAIIKLIKIFSNNDFFIIHSTTPKAGLLSMTAAFVVRAPNRIHTFTGQVWQTKKGFSRFLLKLTDRLTSFFSTKIIVDGFGQLDFLIKNKITTYGKASVLGNGSICGVDTVKFCFDSKRKIEIRSQLGIPPDALLILYMARLTVDKGALVMAYAFDSLIKLSNTDSYLLMVGPDEGMLTKEINQILCNCSDNVRMLGYTREPELYFSAADIFCLPSYREGFPMVLLNAAASSVPSIASNIYGSSDGIKDGITGFLHPAGDHQALARKLDILLSDNALRVSMGAKARERVERDFNKEKITSELLSFYKNQLNKA